MVQTVAASTNVHDSEQVRRLLEREEPQQALSAQIRGRLALELLADSQERGVVYRVLSEAGASVVRFPLDRAQERALEREAAVTSFLSSRVKVDVPDTVFHEATPERPALAVHRWVNGDPLTAEMYDCMGKQERRKLVDDIVIFLTTMHATDRSQAKQLCGKPTHDLLESPQWFDADTRARVSIIPEKILGDRVYAKARATLKGFGKLKISDQDLVLAHGDIHGFNLAMRADSGRYRLCGVFDFGATGLLDINEEFFRLNFVSSELANDVVAWYRVASAHDGLPHPNWERIDLYWEGFLLYLMEEHYRAGELGKVAVYRRFFENYLDNGAGARNRLY